MIEDAMDFLWNQLNIYLRRKLDPTPSGDAIILYNVSHLHEGNSGGAGGSNNTSSNALLTLVNIEEDRIGKQQENYLRRDNTVVYKNPEIYLNLYILISVNLTSYTEALKRLSLVLTFFQYQNVFTSVTHPDLLDKKIEKLVVDLYSMNFEQLNHLWSILGAKYLPSVMYKVRQIIINEDVATSEASFIKEIMLNEKSIRPGS